MNDSKIDLALRLVTYRYLFKGADSDKSEIGVKYVTDVPERFDALDAEVLSDDSIVSCFREYVGEVNPLLIGQVKPVKGCAREEVPVHEEVS